MFFCTWLLGSALFVILSIRYNNLSVVGIHYVVMSILFAVLLYRRAEPDKEDIPLKPLILSMVWTFIVAFIVNFYFTHDGLMYTIVPSIFLFCVPFFLLGRRSFWTKSGLKKETLNWKTCAVLFVGGSFTLGYITLSLTAVTIPLSERGFTRLVELVLIIPVVEEVVYRGLAQDYLTRKFGSLDAIGFSAVLFGILHVPVYYRWNPNLLSVVCEVLAYPTIAGLLYGAMRTQSNNILPCIVTHAAFNAVVVLGRPDNLPAIGLGLVFTLVGVIIWLFVSSRRPENPQFDHVVPLLK